MNKLVNADSDKNKTTFENNLHYVRILVRQPL